MYVENIHYFVHFLFAFSTLKYIESVHFFIEIVFQQAKQAASNTTLYNRHLTLNIEYNSRTYYGYNCIQIEVYSLRLIPAL